jgi:hypothetical protein
MVYGVMLSYFQPGPGATSVGTATLSLIAHLHDRDSTIQLTSAQQRDIRVDGSDGLVSLLQSKLPSGEPQANILVTISRSQGLFYAICIAPQRSFQQLAGSFQQVLDSIRFTE